MATVRLGTRRSVLKRETVAVRELHSADLAAVRRVLETSEYTYYRFTSEELRGILATRPALGAFTIPSGPLGRVTGGTLQAFLVINALVPPTAWLGGFGVVWSESARFADYLDLLLPPITRAVAGRGARTLYYSGTDVDADWLRAALEARDFQLVTTLRSYDKIGFSIPTWGNQRVRVRAVAPADLPGVVTVENAAFQQLWRYDGAGFLEVARTYPYFVVAEDEQGIVGYQFNAVDRSTGYLVRIAIHPRAEGQGVGARLMAEAVRYFETQHVLKIVLNTEETNYRAHRLYERFGFFLVYPRGFVLGRQIETR
jgi:ribosomal-protein-alanine N-acetyltransferase